MSEDQGIAPSHKDLLRSITTNRDIADLLSANTPICLGVSGGKDSQAVALAVARHLSAIGHVGPKILIHADLGRVEWSDSMATCERLAAHLGWELIVVKRQAGDMMDRWLSRWDSSVKRYANLDTVRVVLPWSTPKMRFCTSELKSVPIASAIRKRFPSGPVISVDGVRAQESHARAKKPISAPVKRLTRKGGEGFEWHAILPWSTQDVFDEIEAAGLQPHEAYRVYGSTRVSCAFCIMGSIHDLTAATSAAETHDLYREMVDLECRSTFAFQGARWLGDVAAHLLTDRLRTDLASTKHRAARRQQAEAELPPNLLFGKGGWPSCVPSMDQAELLARIRREVADALGIEVGYTSGHSVRQRIGDLFEQAREKELKAQGVLSRA